MSDPTPPTAEEVGAIQQTERPIAYRAVRGGLWVAGSSYFMVAFGFAANLELTRILRPEDFGIFALATFFFSLFNLRPKCGLAYAFTQRPQTTGELIGTHFVLDVTSALATVVLAALVSLGLRFFGYPSEVVWIILALAGIGIIDAIAGTASVLLDKGLHLGQTSLATTIALPLSYGPAFWLALHQGGFWSLAAQSGTYALLVMVGFWVLARRRLPEVFALDWRFDRKVASRLISFGGVVGLAGLAGLLVTQFDNFLVGSLVGIGVLGFYDRAYRIAQWPSLLVSGVISRAAFYTYARLQDDAVRLQKTVTMSLWMITTLALPLALGIFATAPDLVRLLYDERWLPSAVFLRFLVAYSIIRPLLDDASSLFTAVGRPRLSMTVAVAEAATLVTVGTGLTLWFGALGTCIAVGITFTVGLGLTYRYVIAVIGLRLWQTLGLPGLAAALTLGSYFLLVRMDMAIRPLAVQVILHFAYTTIVYFLIMFAMQPRQMIDRITYVRRLILARPQ